VGSLRGEHLSACPPLFLTSPAPAAILGLMTKARARKTGDSPSERMRPTRRGTVPVFRKRVGFIGAGRVGCAMAWHCHRLGYPIAGVTDLKPKQAWVVYGLMKEKYERMSSRDVAAASDVVFLTVPYTHIVPVFESVRDALGTVPMRGQSPSTDFIPRPAHAVADEQAEYNT